MKNIPAEMLSNILELRKMNGLTATEDAVYSDLTKSKCKWTTVDTPRYRRAGASPLWISGKYLSSYVNCPATGEADQGRVKPPTRNGKASSSPIPKADEEVFYKVLHGKGFPIKITKDLLSGEIQSQVPDAIRKLNLQFGSIPLNASDIHVIQTSPQIQIAMSLDKFIEISGIRA
jgi:hypothetical protein